MNELQEYYEWYTSGSYHSFKSKLKERFKAFLMSVKKLRSLNI